jgi:hypothetical protein
MSLTPTVATLATAGTEKLRELPMPPLAYGGIAFAAFILLLGVLWSFRNTAAKYDTPATPATAGHSDARAEGSHGATDHGAPH